MRFGLRGSIRFAALLALWAAVVVAQSGRPDFSDEKRLREFLVAKAEKTVFPERCAECHKSEFGVWQATAHATAFRDLHTKNAAKQIYGALKLTLIRRATDERTPACLQCHYTPQTDADGLRASIGVSCESCHGPAKDWVGVHNDYGVKAANFQEGAKLETPQHRERRIAESRTKGQLRPSDIYGVAANCFQCHTVPNEDLVNIGGHSAGSTFELVSEIAKIRHNFLQSFLTGNGKTNAESPPEHKRMLYVVGRALDVEYSLRGIAVATKDDSYLQAMVGRHEAAVDALLEIQQTAAIPEVAQILKVIGPAALKPNNRPALIATADAVGAATRLLIERADGKRLAALDSLWDASAKASSEPRAAKAPSAVEPAPAPAPAGGAAVAPLPTSPAAGTAAPASARGGAVPAPTAVSQPAVSPGGPAPDRGGGRSTGGPAATTGVRGEMLHRPPWRPEPAHRFAAIPCTTCHEHKPQIEWFRQDPHAGSAAKFLSGGRDQITIAQKFGLTPDEMLMGNQMCMSCHGTFTGNLNARVRNGVDCQQCHGPGLDYKEPHQDGNYAESIKQAQGLTDLKNPLVRARTCAGCHYITDVRLLSAGHKSGEDFKLDAAVGKTKHWGTEFKGEAVDIAPAALLSAQEAVIRERGPVPSVRVASAAASPASTGAPAPAITAGQPAGGAAEPTPGPAAQPPTAGRSGPAPTAPNAAVTTSTSQGQNTGSAATRDTGGSERRTGQVQSNPQAQGSPATVRSGAGTFTIDPNASVEEILLQLKRRLEQMYDRLRQPGSR